MTRQKLLRIIVPLFVALLVTYAVARLSQTHAAATAPVVVAQSAIPDGSVVGSAEVRVEQVPAAGVWPGSLTSAAQAVGQVALVNIPQGSPLLSSELQAAQAAGLAYAIPPGERGMSIAVTNVSGVAGNLQPGSYVDVMATYPYTSGQGGVPGSPRSSTVVQDVRVLQVGQAAVGGQAPATTNYSLVTLAVTPQQATAIALAEQLGTVDLLLRPANGAGNGMASTSIGGLPK